MNLRSKLLFLAGLFLTVVLISCNKDDDNQDPQPSGAILPSVITYTKSASSMPDAVVNTAVIKFEYDIRDRISKMHSELFDNGVSRGFASTLAFTYNDNGNITTDLTRTDAVNLSDRTLFYCTESEVVRTGNQNSTIKIDQNLRALNYRSYNNTTNYEFAYDAAGNATSITTKLIEAQTTHVYTLKPGQSNGVFRNVKTPAWYITTQMGTGSTLDAFFGLGEIAYQHLTNNCIESIEVDGNIVYEYNYTYNSDNYPTQIIRNPNFTGGEYVRYEIEYTIAQ